MGSGAQGGGLHVDDYGSSFNDRFDSNQALQGSGGGVFGVALNAVSISVTNNTAESGGGIYFYDSDSEISDSYIAGNAATISNNTSLHPGYGGGIACGLIIITTQITNTVVANNTSGDDGGGIFSDSGLYLFGDEIYGNQAAGAGGGVAFEPGTNTISPTTDYAFVVNGVSLHDNMTGEDGGAIFAQLTTHDSQAAAADIAETTISNNTATGSGGGIAEESASGSRNLVVHASTIADNTAATANGVFGTVGLAVGNSIVQDCGGANVTSLGYNLTYGSSCTFAQTGDHQIAGIPPPYVALVPPYSGLFPLADNGGGAKTRALQADSPAIDAGDPTGVLCSEPRDGRGGARIIDGNGDGKVICDIGAFEANPASLALVSTTPAAPAAEGNVTYDFTVTNSTGDPAQDVTLQFPLATDFTFVSSTIACNSSDSPVLCDLGTLAAGASVDVQITLYAAEGATDFSGTASVTTSSPSVAGTTNAALSTTLTPAPGADLSVTLTHFPSAPKQNEPFELLLAITNAGPSDASSVQLTQTLPTGASASNLETDCSAAGGTVTCSLGAIASGQTRSLFMTVSALKASDWSATVKVAALQPDPNDANNIASDSSKLTGGCGCHSSNDASGMFVAFAILLVCVRRRRV